MRSSARGALLGLAALQLTRAEDILYVTELEIYDLLAPCAATAVSYNIALRTMGEDCDPDVTKLQSCICSSSAMRDSVLADVSTSVASDCGRDAKEDQTSASKVMQQYCNPDSTITFPTPTENTVGAYITELSQLEYLAPCAQSALSEAVMGRGDLCPAEPHLYAPCVCTKTPAIYSVSSVLSASVRYSCSNKDDITSAESMYSAYCAMNDGTTAFKRPGGPPGDMSYYITALPQFKSLEECAQSAFSDALADQTVWYCPGGGPQALASCACLKSGMYKMISSTLTSSVKFNCDVTATADVSSALAVLEDYCSAAAAKTTYSVKESVSQSYAETGSGPATGPKETGASGGDKGNDGGDGKEDDKDRSSSGDGEKQEGSSKDGKKYNTAIIAASVLGGIVAIAAIAGAIFFYKRRQKKKAQASEPSPGLYGNGNPPGTPELSAPASDPSRSATGSAKGGVYGFSAPSMTETEGRTPHWELPTRTMTPPPGEMDAQQQIPGELPGLAAGGAGAGRGAPGHHGMAGGYAAQQSRGEQQAGGGNGQQQGPSAVSPLTPQGDGMGWQSGPVPSYELDAGSRR